MAIHGESGNRREEALVLNSLGSMASDQGRFDDARRRYEQALNCAREVGTRVYEGVVLGNLANVSEALGRIDEARQQHENALAIQREVGDLAGLTISNLGQLAMVQDRLGDARALLEEGLAIHRAQGSRRFEGVALRLLAELHLRRGETAAARGLVEASEAVLHEVRDTLELARLACVRGHLAAATGDADAGWRALEQAESVAAEVGAAVDSALGRDVAALRVALDDATQTRHPRA